MVNAYNRELADDLELLSSTVDGSDGQKAETRRTIDLSKLDSDAKSDALIDQPT